MAQGPSQAEDDMRSDDMPKGGYYPYMGEEESSSDDRPRVLGEDARTSTAPPPRIHSSLYSSMLDAFGMTAESVAPSSSERPYGEPANGWSSDSESIDVGDVLDARYEIRQVLERQDGVTLLLAYDRATQTTVTIRLAENSAEGITMRLQLRLARAVSHPTVARIHDFLEGPMGPALIMEAVDETLLHQLESRRVGGQYAADEIRRIATDVGSALAAMHARGFVHAAVNPRHVLLVGSSAKLMISGPVSERERVLANPSCAPLSSDYRYHSPERLIDPSPSRADDVYALGLVLWEALTLGAVQTGISPRWSSMWEDCHATTLYELSTEELRLIFAALSPHPSMRPSASRLKSAMEPPSGASLNDEVLPKRARIDPGPPPPHGRSAEVVPGAQALLVTYASTVPHLAGTRLPLDRPRIALGRRGQDINVPERTLSRCHARLTWEGGGWRIVDHRSANGTYVDGIYDRQERVLLRHGAEVQLGEIRLMLVNFEEGSAHHWGAKQFFARRDGLTTLFAGRHFVKLIEEDLLFARWADLPMHLACFSVQFAPSLRWVTAMLGLRRLAHHIESSTAQRWPGVFHAGCVDKPWPRNPQGTASIFVALLGKSPGDPTGLAEDVARLAGPLMPPGTRIAARVTAAGPDEATEDLLRRSAPHP